jgi:hypothetical protein
MTYNTIFPSYSLLRLRREFMIIAFALTTFSATAQAPQIAGGEVHGSIYALIRGDKSFPQAAAFKPDVIMLPDIGVYLENVATSAKSPSVSTDLNGTFRFSSQPEAVYHLCWHAPGFVDGCHNENITLRSANVYLLPVGIVAEPGTIHGTVTLNDGSACRVVAGYLGANIIAEVTANLPGGDRKVRVNNYNDYVLAGLPSGAIKTVASCENIEASRTVALAGGSVTQNFTLPNSVPSIGAVYAQVAGITVQAAAVGSVAQATIEAKPGSGGFPLHYRWYVDPPVPGFVSPDANTLDVKINGPGVTTIYVLAHDTYGGNAIRRLSVSGRPDRILFGGHVKGDDAPSLSNASVSINGFETKTDSNGNFVLVLPKEEPRYVATIEKVGYQMVSKTFYTPVVGANYELYRARQMIITPGQPLRYVEPARKEGQTPGVEIRIEANSLALGRDGTGALATVPLVMHGASYDLRDSNNPIPGDFTGLDKNSAPFRISTFGAADVSITDAAGNHYNLASGKTALVRKPIDPLMLGDAADKIAVWHFEPVTGIWRQDGEATRNGSYYETTVTHFSAINMDLAFGDGACTRIVVDQGIMPTPFKIRMTPQNGAVVRPDHQDQIVDGPLSVVVRQPPNIDITYDMVDSNGNVIVAAQQTVHTNGSSPTGQQWPTPASASPYADCTSQVVYNEQTAQALFPTSTALDFLTYQTPTSPKNLISGADADSFTTAYYQKIDPGGTKTTGGGNNAFANWKTANGFDRLGETNTKYGNNYDLGFGRDMHMQTGGQTGACASCVAFYVTNYATVEDAVSNGAQKATVAMEYSPANGVSGTPYTKFYVFLGGAIQLSVDLDGNGPKNVPSLCVICHNGNVTSMGADGSMPFARFIPFDVDSFAYTANAAFPQFQRPGNEAAFKELNKKVLKTNTSQPVLSLTTLWYGAEFDTNLLGTFNGAIVPSGWTAPPIPPPDQSALYTSFVKPYCRACHTTRDPGDGQNIAWQTFDSLNQDSFFARVLACNPSSHLHNVMPQAKRTFARFWLSTNPNGPIALGNSNMQGFQPPNNSCPK